MAGANVVTVEKDNWKSEVLESSKPVLVDFWAEWCAPCRAIAPVLDELGKEKADSLTIAKVDVDQHAELASEFGIRAIPTLLLIKNGEVVERIQGAQSKAQIASTIEPHLD